MKPSERMRAAVRVILEAPAADQIVGVTGLGLITPELAGILVDILNGAAWFAESEMVDPFAVRLAELIVSHAEVVES